MRFLLSVAVVCALVLVGCGEASVTVTPPERTGSPAPTSTATPTSQWDTYHLNVARTGDDTGEPSFMHLAQAWLSASLDGVVYAEPLIDGNNVIVATENDSVYDFNAISGRMVWRTHIGMPRTTSFPCGDIRPLGITGTPVIDEGSLFVLAEVENTRGTYRFHLARLNPLTGTLQYNGDVTPHGMNTNTEQQRSALTVSDGHVVITWGGLDGDCGSYHGYIETVSETTGVALAQWNDTVNDNEGGMWAPSGAAVELNRRHLCHHGQRLDVGHRAVRRRRQRAPVLPVVGAHLVLRTRPTPGVAGPQPSRSGSRIRGADAASRRPTLRDREERPRVPTKPVEPPKQLGSRGWRAGQRDCLRKRRLLRDGGVG